VTDPLVVAVTVEGVRSPVAVGRLAGVGRAVLRAEKVSAALISIALVTSSRIARLNTRHLGRRGPTDVIAFGLTAGLASPRAPVIGDVYIAPAVARANARALGVGVREEIVRLVVHGVLHVLGYDHPDGDGRERSPMWRRQEALVRRALGRRAA
jgi:probable rRNA maturation factor